MVNIPKKLAVGDRAQVLHGPRSKELVTIVEVRNTTYAAFSWGSQIPSLNDATPVHHYKVKSDGGEILELSSQDICAVNQS